MSKFRAFQFFNFLILIFGLGLCLLTILLFTKDLPFPVLLLTGASGSVAVSMGSSLIWDMHKYRHDIRKMDFEL